MSYLIDDDPVVTFLLVDLVESVDLPYKVFESAVKFLDQDLTGLEGCIVSDLRMPGMGGLELQEDPTSAQNLTGEQLRRPRSPTCSKPGSTMKPFHDWSGAGVWPCPSLKP